MTCGASTRLRAPAVGITGKGNGIYNGDAKLIVVRGHEPKQEEKSLFSTLFSQNQFVIFFDVAIMS